MTVRDLTLRFLLLDDGKVVLFTAKGGLAPLNKFYSGHVEHLIGVYDDRQKTTVPVPERSRELANGAEVVGHATGSQIKTLSYLAEYSSPISAEELAKLCDKPFGTISSRISYLLKAKLIMFEGNRPRKYMVAPAGHALLAEQAEQAP